MASKDEDILAVETRKDLYDFVRRNPGFHLREVSRALNLSITLADYHLRFLAAVPRYGVHTGLLFGFLLLIVAGLSAVAVARDDDRLHAIGALATVLVFAIWLATSYSTSGWRMV